VGENILINPMGVPTECLPYLQVVLLINNKNLNLKVIIYDTAGNIMYCTLFFWIPTRTLTLRA
jgi:hypothetical protein